MAISLFRTEKDQQTWVLKLRPTLWRPNLPLKDPKQIADLSFYMTALFCSLEQSRNKVAKSILKQISTGIIHTKIGYNITIHFNDFNNELVTQWWCSGTPEIDDKCLKVLKTLERIVTFTNFDVHPPILYLLLFRNLNKKLSLRVIWKVFCLKINVIFSVKWHGAFFLPHI